MLAEAPKIRTWKVSVLETESLPDRTIQITLLTRDDRPQLFSSDDQFRSRVPAIAYGQLNLRCVESAERLA